MEENHRNLTSGQLKYKNSLIWMNSGHMSEMGEKGPQGRCCSLVGSQVFEMEEGPLGR